MLTRRRFLERTLKGSSLVALGPTVPGFLATSARAAEAGKDNVLVVVEMTGGNDGLNTVVPYADDLYHAARPTLRLTDKQVVRVDDRIGLNPGMKSFEKLLSDGRLAVVQGVGYPNPDRSHFESMDIWQTADPSRKSGGWLGRSLGSVRVASGQIPGIYVGTQQLPLAMRGSATGVPTVHPTRPYDLDLATQVPNGYAYQTQLATPAGRAGVAPVDRHQAARRALIEDIAKLSPARDDMRQFVRRTSLQTYATIEDLRKITSGDRPNGAQGFQPAIRNNNGELARNLTLVGNMIAAGFGTRIFYLSISGFDTHANQLQEQQQLLQQLADAVTGFFTQLDRSGHSKRVVLMTFSEFGRRVQENGSRGTDHGAASCLFVAGPGVKGGVVGEHPSLAPDKLDSGDLRHHTDFRRVYASLLDDWLGCESAAVLGGTFEPLPLIKRG